MAKSSKRKFADGVIYGSAVGFFFAMFATGKVVFTLNPQPVAQFADFSLTYIDLVLVILMYISILGRRIKFDIGDSWQGGFSGFVGFALFSKIILLPFLDLSVPFIHSFIAK